jgi:hypothetical protein
MKKATVLCIALCLAAMISTAWAEKSDTKAKTDYKAQLQNLEQQTQDAVKALDEQAASQDPESRQAIQLQIQELKRQGEINRLSILLEWANTDGDQARALEIQQALNQWQNPPQTHQLPTITRDPNEQPGSESIPVKTAPTSTSSK